MSKQNRVYSLSCDGVPFYVGRSANLKARLRGHKTKKANGRIITMEVIDQNGTEENEQYWIHQLITWGFALENQERIPGHFKAKSWKEAARKSNLIRNKDPKMRAKISATLMGHSVSAETREKLRIAHTGRKLSDEHKRKISESMKKRRR